MCVQVHTYMPGVVPRVLSTMSFKQFLLDLPLPGQDRLANLGIHLSLPP